MLMRSFVNSLPILNWKSKLILVQKTKQTLMLISGKRFVDGQVYQQYVGVFSE